MQAKTTPMRVDLAGLTALVTGGGTGIGSACCRALAADGFRVGLHYRSSEKNARELAAELPDAFAVCADLSREGEVDALIAELKEKAGRVDVLVNNAGVNVNAPVFSSKLVSEPCWLIGPVTISKISGAGELSGSLPIIDPL